MKKFLRILAYIKPYWIYALLNVVSNMMVIVFSLVTFVMLIPFLNLLFGIDDLVTTRPEIHLNAQSVIDFLNYIISKIILEQGKVDALIFICLFLFGTFFFRNLFRFLAMFFLVKVRVHAVRDIRDEIYHKILILPLSFYNQRKKGDIMSRITNDVQEIDISIMHYLEIIFRDPVTIIAYFVTLLIMSPQLTVFVMVLLPVAGYVIGTIGRNLRKESKVGQARFSGLLSVVEETIGGLRIIKAFTAIGFSDIRFRELNRNYSRLMVKVFRTRDLSSPMSEFLSSVVIITVLWYGGRLVLSDSGTITAAVFITYILIFSQIIPPVKAFSTGYYNILKGVASAERIFEILDAEEVIVEKENPVRISKFKEKIEYRKVSFRYQTDDVLNKIDIEIPKGKIIALVGPSGGGKTTFVDLLPRFYDTVEGGIYIDGVNIKDYRIDDLRSLMGMVTQESILFNDTVYNNIVFGKQGVTRDDVIAAAKVANAHDFIEAMEEGYDTNIGDRGAKLSGGQRQRISIARAILRNPPILILDEATSSLDSESEKLVQDALLRVMKDRTSIVIAHRLSTIKFADRILVLEKGRIVESGNHDELIKTGGLYKRLHDLQTFA
ncbi:MAG TPA: ABC transporter ATP-binding protein [Bacteroidales bacterium]|nr:ABC transporter ATP-binding protein [Bacteroidales bacterium]HPM93333.1 ABC transporter ATP-binding protein [Bacteroidales bacterium]